tara:strand:- start:582 stop:713 length:132 start_codon:yes stop_codon:yes gene_type:complete
MRRAVKKTMGEKFPTRSATETEPVEAVEAAKAVRTSLKTKKVK